MIIQTPTIVLYYWQIDCFICHKVYALLERLNKYHKYMDVDYTCFSIIQTPLYPY